MAKVYISLGTNLGNKVINLNNASVEIELNCGNVKQKSSIYSSAPWGFESFNNFLNQVILVESDLSPQRLIEELLKIELRLGRNRKSSQYQDRIIDLDILFYDDIVLSNADLIIPHPKLHERNFILEPMRELSPQLNHPVLGKSIEKLALASGDKIKALKYEQ